MLSTKPCDDHVAVRVALDLPDDWRLRVWDDECEAYVLCADEAQPIAQYATAGGELDAALRAGSHIILVHETRPSASVAPFADIIRATPRWLEPSRRKPK